MDALELLDVLTDLPIAAAIPVRAIARPDLRVLRRAPTGVVHTTPTTVTRLLVPVLTPILAVVHASRWQHGLADVSEFGAYLPRMLVLRELPGDDDDLLAAAAWYGIGVAIGSTTTWTTVLAPEPVPDWQPTVAWWRFCERVYRHLLAGGRDIRPTARGLSPKSPIDRHAH
ncbi:hypothetical protein [Kibdelosporangium phytohabitans]|uniref:Uncharacterized protein n=1 Tax=Kibdelosporangium phytohabitans TaxID=860235 RepID=A0A0N9HV60_9PSEU|nr:hypothetical protein [Kibdelosporangium phytohabitans]ALG05787.1 hypothetical protein AOZ06_01575 [Kibdelosporangium phytohabitans]MBE1466205.1 hypothetical protein [Kibdelosporangium phytohabitans]